jgi:copper chaperone NosL
MKRRAFLALALKGAGGLLGLSLANLPALAQPRPLRVGVDRCPYCNMTVVDARYAAQLVTPLGRSYHYDAIECLADHLNGHGGVEVEAGELYAADFANSTARNAVYLPVETLLFLQHPRIRTPMGGGLVAFSEQEAADRFIAQRRLSDVRTLTWEELLAEGVNHPWVPPY